jgi:hypothetical protein
VSKPPTPTPRVLPSNVILRLATLAGVPTTEQELFHEQFSFSLAKIWQRASRALSSKPGPALVRAARAATTLQKEFYRLSQQDREWLENIRSTSLVRRIPVEKAIVELELVFNHAIGRPSRRRELPRKWRLRVQFKVKDQMLRELVFSLLRATRDNYGEFTLDKNRQSGTLLKALDILRPHLPKGLVPNALPVGTIQKLKTEFSRSERL